MLSLRVKSSFKCSMSLKLSIMSTTSFDNANKISFDVPQDIETIRWCWIKKICSLDRVLVLGVKVTGSMHICIFPLCNGTDLSTEKGFSDWKKSAGNIVERTASKYLFPDLGLVIGKDLREFFIFARALLQFWSNIRRPVGSWWFSGCLCRAGKKHAAFLIAACFLGRAEAYFAFSPMQPV